MGFLFVLILLPLASLLTNSGRLPFEQIIHSKYLKNVIWFSVWQASLSTILAVGLAIPVAFSLARQTQFTGRSLLIRLFSISLIIPSIVAVFGIIAVFGNNGWLNQVLKHWDQDGFSIYGITGILIAHVFFNLPLSARIMLHAIEKIPAENWRLSSQLGMSAFQSFRLLQWPVIRGTLAGTSLLVFSLCFTSFAIVMTLGGGPASTTIEIAIYQALRFEFDIDSAVSLGVVQIALCLVLILLNAKFGRSPDLGNSRGSIYTRRDGDSLPARSLDVLFIGLATLLVSLPFIAIVLSGVSTAFFKVVRDISFWSAMLNTIIVSLTAGCLAVLLACGLLVTSVHLRVHLDRHLPGRLVELCSSVILVVPPLVLGTGLFLLLRDYTDVFSLALILTILINALMSLPFAVRVLENPLLNSAMANDRLCESLALSGFNRWRVIEWPVLRKSLALALAFSSTLAAGDLTVIALFGTNDVRTLPLLLYQRMGSYQFQEAAATALLLLIFCFSLFWGIERAIGGQQMKEQRA